jgi:hypothetical protein
VAIERDVLITDSAPVACRGIGKSYTQVQQGFLELLWLIVLHRLTDAKSWRGREGYVGKRRGPEGERLRRAREAAGPFAEEGLNGSLRQ